MLGAAAKGARCRGEAAPGGGGKRIAASLAVPTDDRWQQRCTNARWSIPPPRAEEAGGLRVPARDARHPRQRVFKRPATK